MIRRFLFFALSIFLAGCSGLTAPRLIASYPKLPDQPAPPQGLPPQYIVYNANLLMEVADPQDAARQAADLANRYGGYVTGSDSWYSDGRQVSRVDMAVPVPSFDPFYAALRSLGDVKSERLIGERTEYGPGGWTNYSHVSVEFDPQPSRLPRIAIGGWHPLETLGQAWSVFLGIFGFLVDIVIWLLVVLGPFVLLAWIIWKIIKRARV